MVVGSLVKLGGKSALVSRFAGKVIKGADATHIYRAANGFNIRLAKWYPGPNATLTEASKTLKDGRQIYQKLWSWADGSTIALTRKSDGFFSYVVKSADGKVTSSMISRNGQHMVQKASQHQVVNGINRLVPYENYVQGNNIARFRNGQLWHADASELNAKYLVSETRKDLERHFACIG